MADTVIEYRRRINLKSMITHKTAFVARFDGSEADTIMFYFFSIYIANLCMFIYLLSYLFN